VKNHRLIFENKMSQFILNYSRQYVAKNIFQKYLSIKKSKYSKKVLVESFVTVHSFDFDCSSQN